jgi:succinate-semialdehyde dehydrogenase / glutarate-semialdehyde dehydrogenase
MRTCVRHLRVQAPSVVHRRCTGYIALMPIATIDPATGQSVRTYEAHDAAEIERRLARAAEGFQHHRRSSFAERRARMIAAADLLDWRRETYARLLVTEMGKTIRAARAEIEKCAATCRHYAEHAEGMLADEPAAATTGTSKLVFLPIGPVLAVMPWNFPFWQVIRFAAPALMAGNVALLKHASNVPGAALALEELFADAGWAPGAFQTLLVGSDAVAAVVGDARVAAVTLTGSAQAGASVAEAAGRHLKKCVLELGGSDPFVVMPSADVAAAAATAVTARTINNGQSCIAAKRFIVHDAVYDRFVAALVEGMRRLKVGDPAAEDTDLGPLATAAGRDTLNEQVKASAAAGTHVALGGHLIDGPGYYYAATVLTDIPPAAPAYRDEIFGPVALVFRARDVDHAIELANDSPYGLGSSVWTADAGERDRFVREIEAGMTFVNGMVVSDARLPFGGVKHSGYGRELGTLGIREFTNIKTVVVAASSAGSDVE